MNEAEAKKIMQVKEAEAEKESKILLWEGMAGQRMKIAEWFKESVDLIKMTDDSLNAEKVLAFLLDSSRIETLWTIGSQDNSKLVYLNEDLEWRSSKLISGSEIMEK
jgi:regulator of protease activity HflC (stomatin/prohibitin superfamily)